MRISRYLQHLDDRDAPQATGPTPMRVDPRDRERCEMGDRTHVPCDTCGRATELGYSRHGRRVCLACRRDIDAPIHARRAALGGAR